jgi:hypothetical protein
MIGQKLMLGLTPLLDWESADATDHQHHNTNGRQMG